MKHFTIFTFITLLFITTTQGQEDTHNPSSQEQLHIKIKDNAEPDIYVDGKKFDFPLELIDVNKIESINVLKGDAALKKYKSTRGAVLITTKKIVKEIAINARKFDSIETKKNAPLIFINGEQSNQKALKKLAPDDIESIEIFKNNSALKKYNAPQGAIVVTTKMRK